MMYLNIAISLCLVLATLTTSVLPKPMSDSWPQDVNEPFSGDVDCKDRSCIWNKLVMMGLAKSTTYRPSLRKIPRKYGPVPATSFLAVPTTAAAAAKSYGSPPAVTDARASSYGPPPPSVVAAASETSYGPPPPVPAVASSYGAPAAVAASSAPPATPAASYAVPAVPGADVTPSVTPPSTTAAPAPATSTTASSTSTTTERTRKSYPGIPVLQRVPLNKFGRVESRGRGRFQPDCWTENAEGKHVPRNGCLWQEFPNF